MVSLLLLTGCCYSLLLPGLHQKNPGWDLLKPIKSKIIFFIFSVAYGTQILVVVIILDCLLEKLDGKCQEKLI